MNSEKMKPEPLTKIILVRDWFEELKPLMPSGAK
jgi:hypothetical protein